MTTVGSKAQFLPFSGNGRVGAYKGYAERWSLKGRKAGGIG